MQELSRQGYTAAQVDAALRAGTGTYGARFEILDPQLRVVGNLDFIPAGSGVTATAPGSITAAKIEVDVDRPLRGALDLTMLPDERLREAPFKYRIKPYLQVGPMPDGGRAEFPLGVYVFEAPERDTAPGLEEWHVTLADGLRDLDSAGPDTGGFTVAKGERHTDAMKRILNLGGYADTSGIRDADHSFPGNRTWGITRPRIGWGFTYLEGFTEGWGFYTDGQIISVGGDNPNATRTTTLLDIAAELHTGIGYDQPWMDPAGVYQARPAVDWSKASSVATFGTATNSITLTPIHLANDNTKAGNRARVWSEAGDTALFFAEADANLIVPNHPLAQANTRRYMDVYDPRSTATSQAAADSYARKLLLDGLSRYQRVSYTTFFYPLDPFDVVGVMVAGDAELATEQLYQERRYTLDLWTGIMSHEGNRVIAATTAGAGA